MIHRSKEAINNLISVCIITYNQEQYIRRAIDSVLAQTGNMDIEIVISDDGSNDNTLPICTEYQQKHPDSIRVVTSTINRGVLSNWYQAIESSTGTYIALLEGDDYWTDPQKLSKQYAILQKENAIGFVYSDFFYLDEKKGTLIQGMNQYKPSNNLFEETLFNQAMVSSTLMFRRSLFEPVLFQQFIAHRFLTPDLPLFLQFCLTAQGYFLSDNTTIYTWKTGSVSRPTTQQEDLRFRESIYRIRLFFILKRGENKKLLLAKNEFIWHKEQLLIAWKYNDYQNARQIAYAFPFMATWQKDKKIALLSILSRYHTSFRLFRPYITRNRPLE
jgi:glycosyltransferase involved in cell wall biosynthesis